MNSLPTDALVSVIVATNRRSPFLQEALASVGAQTHRRVEVLVIDDGSDDPDSIARTVALHPGVTLIRQAASGVSIARNAGVAAASGEILAFLDDDDRWHPRRLEIQLRALEQTPDAVLSYCGMRSINESGDTIAAAGQSPVTDEVDVARRAAGIILPNVLIRRDAFDAVGGFRPDLRLAEDLDLVLSLARRGRFVFTPDVLVDYRAHGANTTKRYRALAIAIDAVVKSHLRDALQRGDGRLASAHRSSLRANGRYAWWAALRSARAGARGGHPGGAIVDVGWALGFAPLALPDAVLRRVRRRH
jgi:alpha-1,3-rhamnosyltransferase